MIGFVLAFLLGLVVADQYKPDSSLTTYQPYHEEHINLIVENTNEKPIEAVFISETSEVYDWSDNQLQNYNSNKTIYEGQAIMIQGLPCGWDMDYDMKVTFARQGDSNKESQIRYAVPAPCGPPIYWKVP